MQKNQPITSFIRILKYRRVKTENHPLVWKENIMSRRNHREFLVSGLTLGTWMLVDGHAYDKREVTDPRAHALFSYEDTQNHQTVHKHQDSLEQKSF
jgi:hypothetical protein